MLLRDLVLRIRPYFIGGLHILTGLPRPFGRYWLASFLWYHLGPMVIAISLGVSSLPPVLIIT